MANKKYINPLKKTDGKPWHIMSDLEASRTSSPKPFTLRSGNAPSSFKMMGSSPVKDAGHGMDTPHSHKEYTKYDEEGRPVPESMRTVHYSTNPMPTPEPGDRWYEHAVEVPESMTPGPKETKPKKVLKPTGEKTTKKTKVKETKKKKKNKKSIKPPFGW